MEFGKAIRSEWLLDDDVVFLNHGSFGATPREVLAVQRSWQERLEREPVRFFRREFPKAAEMVQARLAEFVRSRPEDLVFVENASMGVNAVLRSLMPEFTAEDEILTTTHVYGAVRQTLRYVSDVTNVRVVEAPVPFPVASPDEIVECVMSRLTERTRFVILDHVTSATGIVLPIERIIPEMKSRGIPVMIDGAHAPGMLDLDMEKIGADYYTGNCHKWLFAPKGAAFLWVAPQSQKKIHPVVISHLYGKGFQQEFGWTGTRDESAILSIAAGIDFMERFGAENVRRYNHKLLLEARDIVMRELGVEAGAPESMLTSLCTLPIPGDPAADEAYVDWLHDELFDHYHIEMPAMMVNGHSYFRFSAQIYNELDEYRTLGAALRGVFHV